MAALPRTEMFLSDGGKCRCHLGGGRQARQENEGERKKRTKRGRVVHYGSETSA